MYLSKDNPRAQSGHGGDEYHYIFAELPIIEAIYKNGTFCDVGCANGHLMEMLYKWATAIGFELQMFGVDMSEGLIELAKAGFPSGMTGSFVAMRFIGNLNKNLIIYFHVP